MEIDLDFVIKDENGETATQKYKKTVVDENGNEIDKLFSENITVGRAIRDCVMTVFDQPISEEEVLLRGDIYDKVCSGNGNFSKVEIKLIKELVNKRYMPLFRWQILRNL